MRIRVILLGALIIAVAGLVIFQQKHANSFQVTQRPEVSKVSSPKDETFLPNQPKAILKPFQVATNNDPMALLFSRPPRLRTGTTNQYTGPTELRSYVEGRVLETAERLNKALKFETNSGLTLDSFLYKAQATTNGVSASFSPKNGRFTGVITYGALEMFKDWYFDESALQRDPERLTALTQAPNFLDESSAAKAADTFLGDLGYSKNELNQYGEPKVTQGLLDSERKLSYYIVQYFGPREPGENQHEAICVKIIGVVPGGMVVALNDYTFSDKRPPLPATYLEAFHKNGASQTQKALK